MLEKNRVYNGDCMYYLKLLDDKSVDIHYTDTPYNLGSKYTIDKEGHYVFKNKVSDFMDKWEAMDGRWWDKYFNEIERTLKYGGFYITHNIDRQSDMWTYYARKNGLLPIQKLYWLFITNFPKAMDVAKLIDKKLNVKQNETDAIAKDRSATKEGNVYGTFTKIENRKLTEATSELAKKYDGYKYSSAPLKQILEEILIFQKEPKDSVINDLMEFETNIQQKIEVKNIPIHPSIFNIKKTLVTPTKMMKTNVERYTPQLAVNVNNAHLMRSSMLTEIDTAGVHNLMQRVEILENEIPYLYEPKISNEEKNEDLDGHSYTKRATGKKGLYDENGRDKWSSSSKNTHPTPKPINLCKWILNIFNTPDDILVVDTFAGQGSILKACKEMNINYIGMEINEEYYRLINSKLNSIQQSLF